MRLSSNDLAPQVANALSELDNLLKELMLDSSTSSLIAMSRNSGDYLNFNSNMSGSIKELVIEQGVPKFYKEQLHAAQNYSFRANKIIELLKAKYPSLTSEDGSLKLSNKHSLSAPEFLYALISQPQYMLVINDREPVIIPFFSQEHCNNTLNNPQERLNAVKTVGITSALLASFFASSSAKAAEQSVPTNVEPNSTVNPDHASMEIPSSASDNIDPHAPSFTPSFNADAANKEPEAKDNEGLIVDENLASAGDSQETKATKDQESSSTLSAAGSAGAASASSAGAAAAGAAGAGAGAGGAAAAGRSLGGCLIPSLIALLVLLALLAFYFFKLYPWPFDKANEQELLLDQLNEQVIEDELNLNKINELIEKTQEKIALGQQDAQALQLSNLKDTLSKDEQTLKEIERLLGLVNDKDEQIKAQEQALAQEEAAKAAAEAAEAAKADEEAQAAQVDKGSNVASLPKCETIVKQGKMPNLIIASDGSGSMINLLSDGSLRIDAAIKAAHALIDQVDKNVPIRLFGIQGCPLARDYGTFSGNERQRLKAAVAKTNPMLQSIPFQVLTPLVSGLRGMASAAPKNADSIGVLISDGVDTCDGTENLNLCEVARQIHRSKPRLKIHVVLIGEDAPDAKCIADITGGKVYKPGNTRALIEDLKNAGKSLQKVCR